MELLTTNLTTGVHLDESQIADAAAQLVDAAVTAAAKANFLRALAHKGETPAEIAMFVKEFLKLAVDPGIDRAKLPGPMLDVVGTGGDQLHLFNVSSTAMFILAAGGVGLLGSYSLGQFSKDIYQGFTSMQEIFLLSMLIGGLGALMERQGGLAWISARISALIARFMQAYGEAQNEHRVLTDQRV